MHVNISSEVNIWTEEHDMNSPGFEIVGEAVVVEDYAWLGNRSIILPGVRIGRGAVVCSGAVVTKDVPAGKVVGGVPARIIGERQGEMNYSPAKFGKLWFA
jgi:acetyltransferase-like isoleucine patch superfamily enzyme